MYEAEKHYRKLYDGCNPEFGFKGTTREEWERWRSEFRPRLRRALGLERMETELGAHRPGAVLVGSEDLGTFTRESWYLKVEPTVELPFYRLLPKERSGPLPLVLTPHGHNRPGIYVGITTNADEERALIEGERDVAVQGVEQNYIVIAATTRGFGETRTEQDTAQNALSSCQTQLARDLMVGRTPIGERVWDVSRLIDWAVEQGEVDPERIAITGNSGGGTVSLFAAACDERISVAVPSCYFCTFRGSIGTIRHCACNYIPGILDLGEMYDVAGLIAPRPFRAIAGVEDDIFPIDHTRFAFEKLQHIYAAAGVPEKCELYEGQGGHRYYKEGAWPFINRHLSVA